MRGIWLFGLAALAGGSQGAMAQVKDPTTIQVTGLGSIETQPDMANIAYSVRGDGATSDEAVQAMVARKAAVEQALRGMGAQSLKIATGNMRVVEVRGPGCTTAYDRPPQAAVGDCAVRGYSAQMAVSLRMAPAAAAGTMSGLAARAGASEVNLAGFWLGNPDPVRQQALAAAMADGRAQAEAIARAAGVKLGPLIRVTDPYGGGRASLANAAFGESRPRVETPVRVDIAPAPVTTSVSLGLTFAIAE